MMHEDEIVVNRTLGANFFSADCRYRSDPQYKLFLHLHSGFRVDVYYLATIPDSRNFRSLGVLKL